MQFNEGEIVMKYKKISFILFFSFVSLLWGKNNSFKNLYTVQTTWFDIIYPEQCITTAEILYQNADKIYAEVTEQYGIQPDFRIPVVINPSVDSFNAFWTSAPYNHIVIYDTSVSLTSDLAVFSETLLQTFRHELTHAVTYNMKNPFWKVITNIFGDSIVPSSLWISPGMAEGATVTSESASGEGRLNNEFAKHIVKQAKIENNFPSYYDVTGASDKYPVGSYYYFNGAFHQWLQEKYGLQKYAQFWYRLVNLKSLTVGIAFKKVYGIHLTTAWDNFIQDYQVPDISANLLDSGVVQDFFNSQNTFFSDVNNSGAHFVSLTRGKKSLAWLDSYGGKVNYLPIPENQTQTTTMNKVQTLFYLPDAQKIALSQDNRFMAVSYYSENDAATKAKVKIYDLQNKNFYTVKTDGLKDAAIITKNGKYYLVSTKFELSKNTIYMEEIVINEKNKICDTQFFYKKTLPLNENAGNFVQTEDGKFACLYKNRMDYSIVVFSIDNSSLSADYDEYKMPLEKMQVKSLSYDDKSNSLYFSWAVPQSMPRLGVFNISHQTFALSSQKSEISGGIFEPVVFGNDLAFIGQFYRFSRILKIPDFENNTAFFDFSSYKTSSYNPHNKYNQYNKDNDADDELLDEKMLENQIASDNLENFNPKKYNPLKYVFGGLFLPFSQYTTEYFGYNAYETVLSDYLLGVTFLTSAPWTGGSDSLYYATVGYDFLTNSFGVELNGQNATFSNLFSIKYDVKSEFNNKGWKNSGASITANLNFETGNTSTISFGNQISGNIGYIDNLSGLGYHVLPDYEKNIPPENTIYYTFSDAFGITFSNVYKSGYSRYEKQGFSYNASLGYRYDSDLSDNPVAYINALQLEQTLKVYIPRLLPHYSHFGKTTNLPTVLEFSVFPIIPQYLSKKSYKTLGKSFIDAKFETVLFAYEIQKAIPVLHAMFVNDFSVSAGYNFSIATGNELSSSNIQDYAAIGNYTNSIIKGNCAFLDSIFVKVNLSVTPNLGGFTGSSFKSNLYVKCYYNLRKEYFIPQALPLYIELGLFAAL